MSGADRKFFDRVKFWCNRADDAWAMGEADWLRENGKPHLLAGYAEDGIRAGDSWEDIAKRIEAIAKERGIDPKRHRWRGKG